MTNYFNKFRNGFQGQLPDAPIAFSNLVHSSDPAERMIYLSSVYVEQNWNKLIDKLNASIVHDSDIDKVDWQTKILDAISDLNGISEQDVRPTINNVVRMLRENPELCNFFSAQDDDYTDDIKDRLLNEYLPSFVQFLEQGIITDADLGKYADRLRHAQDSKELNALKKELTELRKELEQSKQAMPSVKPIENIHYGGFVTAAEAKAIGAYEYVYIVKADTR